MKLQFRILVLTLVCLLLVAMMGPAVLADGAPTTITWMSWGHARPQEIRNEALEAAFPDAGYVIEPVIGGSNVPEVVQKMRLGFASGQNLPDIFQTSSMYFPEMAASGMLADLTPVYDQFDSQLLDGMKDLCTYDGKQYAFPYALGTLIWIYRSDIFEQAGIDASSITDMDGFIAAGHKLREAFPDAYIHAGSAADMADYFYWCLPGTGMNSLIDEAGNYNFADKPEVAAVMQDVKKLYDSGLVYDVPAWTPDWEQGFGNDKIVSYLICNWFQDAAFLPNYAPHTAGKWDATVWPSVGGGLGGSEFGGAVIMVLNDSPNKDAAIDMLTKVTFSKEGGLAAYEASSKSLIPVLTEAYNDPMVAAGSEFFGDVFWKAEMKSMELFKMWNYTNAASLEYDIIKSYMVRYLTGELSLEDALGGATQDLKTQIGNPLDFS